MKLFLFWLLARGPIGSDFPVIMFSFPILKSTQLSFFIFLFIFLSWFAVVNNGESIFVEPYNSLGPFSSSIIESFL